LKFGDVASDLTAPIISDADCRVTCPDTRKQERCCKQTLHYPYPWFEQADLMVLRDARNSKSFFLVRALSRHQ
jgi:hypothetical protein